MTVKRWLGLLAAALLAGVVGIWLFRSSGASAAADDKDLLTVQRVDFPLLVTAPGILEAANRWIECDEGELTFLLSSAEVPRAFEAGTAGCPKCGNRLLAAVPVTPRAPVNGLLSRTRHDEMPVPTVT